jgi:hypothetical protein
MSLKKLATETRCEEILCKNLKSYIKHNCFLRSPIDAVTTAGRRVFYTVRTEAT